MERDSSVIQQLLALQDGTYGLGGEGLDWTYYDTMAVDQSTPTLSYRFFTIPLGQGGKNLADTNMKTASMIPQGQKFAIYAIGGIYRAAAEYDAAADYQAWLTMLERTTIDFQISGKATLLQMTLSQLFGVHHGLEVATATIVGFPTIQKAASIVPLNTPILLASLVNFEIELVHHAALDAAQDGDKIKILLIGKLARQS